MTATLLAAVDEMLQLTRLQLRVDWFFTPSAAAYTALTASSHLHDLWLSIHPVPLDAWQYMFAHDKSLQYLAHLSYMKRLSHWQGSSACLTALAPPDLAAMVSCCPNLCDCRLKAVPLQPSACLAPLQQLTRLTRLSIRLVSCEQLNSMAWLTGLRSLELDCGVAVPPSVLQQFTVLTQLTVLDMHWPGLGWRGPQASRITVSDRNVSWDAPTLLVLTACTLLGCWVPANNWQLRCSARSSWPAKAAASDACYQQLN